MTTFRKAQLDGFKTQIEPQWDGLDFPDDFFFFPFPRLKKERENPPVPLHSLSLKADGQINRKRGW